MSYVFLSYVREDAGIVDQLAKELTRAGVPVWLDRQDLRPGEIWPERITTTITEAALVVVCFSAKFLARDRSYANKELTLAINEMNLRPWGRRWLIPARLSDCAIPPRPINAGFDLSQIQSVDLFKEWRQGILRITTLFRDQTSQEAPQSSPQLTVGEATAIIQRAARQFEINVGAIQDALRSDSGTDAFRAREVDEKGVIYCHATGAFRGTAFYVRKGIGYYYEYVLGGSESRLGLPVSNEELASQGFTTSYFERGYIEWSSRTSVARAVAYTEQGERSFHDKVL